MSSGSPPSNNSPRKSNHGAEDSSEAPGLLEESPEPFEPYFGNPSWGLFNFSRQNIKDAANTDGEADGAWLLAETFDEVLLLRGAEVAEDDCAGLQLRQRCLGEFLYRRGFFWDGDAGAVYSRAGFSESFENFFERTEAFLIGDNTDFEVFKLNATQPLPSASWRTPLRKGAGEMPSFVAEYIHELVAGDATRPGCLGTPESKAESPAVNGLDVGSVEVVSKACVFVGLEEKFGVEGSDAVKGVTLQRLVNALPGSFSGLGLDFDTEDVHREMRSQKLPVIASPPRRIARGNPLPENTKLSFQIDEIATFAAANSQ
jgi:hypothetical protein